MKTVHILRCHYDNFRKHPGWWATFRDPELKKGENFTFEVNDRKELASCLGVFAPGQNRETLEKLQSGLSDFRDWFIILYASKVNPQ